MPFDNTKDIPINNNNEGIVWSQSYSRGPLSQHPELVRSVED